MNERVKSFLLYAAKCITGTITVFLLASLIGYRDLGWCLISVILVLSPESNDSLSLAVTRIKANVVGAASGLVCILISTLNMWILSLALTLALSFCYLLKLENGERSALAATIIIMLHEEGKHVWDTAIERVIAVLAGCALGWLITFFFHHNRGTPITADAKKTGDA